MMMTSFLLPFLQDIDKRFFSLLFRYSGLMLKSSGLEVPTELALVPSPPLCGTEGVSCSS